MSFPYGTSCYNRSTLNSLMAVGTGEIPASWFKVCVICECVLWLSQTEKKTCWELARIQNDSWAHLGCRYLQGYLHFMDG